MYVRVASLGEEPLQRVIGGTVPASPDLQSGSDEGPWIPSPERRQQIQPGEEPIMTEPSVYTNQNTGATAPSVNDPEYDKWLAAVNNSSGLNAGVGTGTSIVTILLIGAAAYFGLKLVAKV